VRVRNGSWLFSNSGPGVKLSVNILAGTIESDWIIWAPLGCPPQELRERLAVEGQKIECVQEGFLALCHRPSLRPAGREPMLGSGLLCAYNRFRRDRTKRLAVQQVVIMWVSLNNVLARLLDDAARDLTRTEQPHSAFVQ
jgi:hypothetical protein